MLNVVALMEELVADPQLATITVKMLHRSALQLTGDARMPTAIIRQIFLTSLPGARAQSLSAATFPKVL